MSHAATTLDLLDRSRESLTSGYAASAASARYLAASLAALRAGAALVAARSATRPGPGSPPAATARTTSGRSPPGSPPSSPSGRSGSPPPPGSGSGSRPGWCGSPPARPTTCCATPRPSSTSPPGRLGRAAGAPAAAAGPRPLGLRRRGRASPTSTSPRGSRCATAPRPRRRWSSAPPSTASGALALTDRDGLYGAVRFVHGVRPRPASRRCSASTSPSSRSRPAPAVAARPAGPGHPAGAAPGTAGCRAPASAPRTPVRGGAIVDPRRPRVTVLARGRGGGTAPGVGWAALCRLVTETHLRGERGEPVTSPDLLATWPTPRPTRATSTADERDGVEPRRLVVLLGPDSDVGRARARRAARPGPRPARRLAARCCRATALAVEVVHHGGPEGTPGVPVARRPACSRLADAAGLPAVLTAAVRHADPEQVRTVDVLDAARRLVVARLAPPRPGHRRRPPRRAPPRCTPSPSRSPAGDRLPRRRGSSR